MAAPQFISEKPLSLSDVKVALEAVEKRDGKLNYLSNKTKEYLDNFPILSLEKKEELYKKLTGLGLTRLKEEHFCKIISYMPATIEELKVVLQAYPLSMPKKDQEAIVEVIRNFK